MRDINKVIIHCADTPPEMDIGAEEIRQWHKDRGWSDIGYHFVIRRDGTIENGRDVSKTGAHARGNNKDSIGVCLVGGRGDPVANFTAPQYLALISLCKRLQNEYNRPTFSGHYQLDSGKTCPNFNVEEFLKGVL